MAQFDAGADVLTYDFTKYVTGAKGEIPEPSGEAVETFMEVLRQVMPSKEEDGKIVLDVEALKARVEEGDDLPAILDHAIEALCSGSPSAEQIQALPFRVKQRFYGWIVGTFLSPEA